MSEQTVILAPAPPKREDARDLQSRLYREIGLTAVATELFGPNEVSQSARAAQTEPNYALVLREGRAA